MTRQIKNMIIGLTVLAVLIYYFYFDSMSNLFFACPFYKITGFYCFGCGGQRAFHALLHGRFVEAFHDNLLIFMVLAIAGIRIIDEFFEKKYVEKYLQQKKFVAIIVLIFIVFGILRNLPFEPFTALIP